MVEARTACQRFSGMSRSSVTFVVAVVLIASSAVAALAVDFSPAVRAIGTTDLLVGDSVMAGMSSSSREVLDAHVFDARVCRRLVSTSCSYRGSRPSTALSVVRERDGSFDRAIVVAAGYNDGAVADAVDAIVAEARRQGVAHVVWLTYREAGRNATMYASHNATLRAKVDVHPELAIADWASLSAERSDWVSSDGLHLNGAGAVAMAGLIERTLDALAPPTPVRCLAAAAGAPDPPRSSIGRTHAARPVVVGERPVRVVDTRSTFGGMIRAGHHLRIPVTAADVPEDATSVVATVTAVDPCGPAVLTSFACDGPLPETSTLNTTRGGATSNLAIVPVVDGEICVSTSVATDLVVDVVGFLASTGHRVQPVAARRLVDTRPGKPDLLDVPDGAIGAGRVVRVPVTTAAGAGPQTGVGDDAVGVVVNVAVTGNDLPGFLTVYPGPCIGEPPTVSNLSHAGGETIATAAVTRIGVDGTICVYSEARSHVLVDLAAVIGAEGSRVQLVENRRMGDTRALPEARDSEVLVRPASFGAPRWHDGAIINVVAIGERSGFTTVRPCGRGGWPEHSTLNHPDGEIANLAVSGLGEDAICLFREVPAHLVIDAVAWLVP